MQQKNLHSKQQFPKSPYQTYFGYDTWFISDVYRYYLHLADKGWVKSVALLEITPYRYATDLQYHPSQKRERQKQIDRERKTEREKEREKEREIERERELERERERDREREREREIERERERER